MRDEPHLQQQFNEFRWRSWNSNRPQTAEFEWRGWYDDEDMAEYIGHGLHGRRPWDDRPVTGVEHKRLAADERADLRAYEASLRETSEDKPPTPKRQRKRGVLASVRQMSPEDKAALRRQWFGEEL